VANVRWTLRAAIDLQTIFAFIGEHNASAAPEIVRKVRSAALSLAEHPRKAAKEESGRHASSSSWGRRI
jgi:plasmid stabilization system protein ParE